MKPSSFLHFAAFGVKTILLRKKEPILGTVILTDKCNLHCKHCSVNNITAVVHPFEQIRREMQQLYDMGVRILFFCGGETFLWRDGERTLSAAARISPSGEFSRSVSTCCGSSWRLRAHSRTCVVRPGGITAPRRRVQKRSRMIAIAIAEQIRMGSIAQPPAIRISSTPIPRQGSVFRGESYQRIGAALRVR